MIQSQEWRYGVFRCPVCGYRDEVEIKREEGRGIVKCVYCKTPLEISVRSLGCMRLKAKLYREIPAH